MTQIIDGFKDMMFPNNRCMLCGKNTVEENSPVCVCNDCLTNMLTSNLRRCDHCGSFVDKTLERCPNCGEIGLPPLERVVAAAPMNDVYRRCIHDLKYHNHAGTARRLADFMSFVFLAEGLRDKVDCLVPVPLHSEKLRQRGYNQALVLAKIVGANLNLPVYHNVAIRVKNTASQTDKNRIERLDNLRNAFGIGMEASLTEGKNVLIIDDIFTTGATMRELAKTLKDAGCGEIYGLVAAGGILK